MDVRKSVLQGYSDRIGSLDGAMGSEAQQVCRMDAYEPALLNNVPAEIVARDYGCGNPSKFAAAGETVLDLGSGSGKICYILSQIVGAGGQVIGVDMNKDMLELARAHQDAFAHKMGYSNLRFAWGSIDDLQTDLHHVEQAIAGRTLQSIADYDDLQHALREQKQAAPLIADNSVDLVVSNCVINLVEIDKKRHVLEEIFRVLKPGGRIALSDNVSNVEVPEELRNDPELWVGCYSGVYQEQDFYDALCDIGFVGLKVDDRADVPEKTIGEVTFQSVTVTAFKPAAEEQDTTLSNVMYKGPWSEVTLETGSVLKRGQVTQLSSDEQLALRQAAFVNEVYFLNDNNNTKTSGCCG